MDRIALFSDGLDTCVFVGAFGDEEEEEEEREASLLPMTDSLRLDDPRPYRFWLFSP